MFWLFFSIITAVKFEKSPNSDTITAGKYCVINEKDPNLVYGSTDDSYNNDYAMWPHKYYELRDIAIEYDGTKPMFSLNKKFAWKFHENTRLAYGTTDKDRERGMFKFERLSKHDNNHVIKNYIGECLKYDSASKYSVFSACNSDSTRYIFISNCNSMKLLKDTINCLLDDNNNSNWQCLASDGPRRVEHQPTRNYNYHTHYRNIFCRGNHDIDYKRQNPRYNPFFLGIVHTPMLVG